MEMVTGENGWTPSQIKELIEQAISAERRLRNHLRAEDRERFEEYKLQAARAIELRADQYARRLALIAVVVAAIGVFVGALNYLGK